MFRYIRKITKSSNPENEYPFMGNRDRLGEDGGCCPLPRQAQRWKAVIRYGGSVEVLRAKAHLQDEE